MTKLKGASRILEFIFCPRCSEVLIKTSYNFNPTVVNRQKTGSEQKAEVAPEIGNKVGVVVSQGVPDNRDGEPFLQIKLYHRVVLTGQLNVILSSDVPSHRLAVCDKATEFHQIFSCKGLPNVDKLRQVIFRITWPQSCRNVVDEKQFRDQSAIDYPHWKYWSMKVCSLVFLQSIHQDILFVIADCVRRMDVVSCWLSNPQSFARICQDVFQLAT